MNQKTKKVYSALKRMGMDSLILSSAPNISYLTDSRSRDSYLLLSGKKNIYFTDSRYTEEAKKALKHFSIEKIDGPFSKALAGICKGLGLKKVGFEEEKISFAGFQKIKKELGSGIDFLPTHNIVEDLRLIKTSGELDKIKTAIRITLEALSLAKGLIVPGRKELEIAGELERFIRYKGATNSAFDIIIASGLNSSFPHHLTSDRKIRNNETVIIDMGVDYLGYKSDLTRVFFLGKISVLAKKVFDIVKTAQLMAIKQIKPGISSQHIDGIVRQYLEKKGFGACFKHSLGHGVGLEVHEAPFVSKKQNYTLKEGMVFTVEPALYLPGKFGVRIEDMVLVTKKGAKIISGTLN